MNALPPISIVVPSFNQAAYLGETLQSLVDQDYPALEVIIQEGGSKDGSIEIARDYAARYPHLFKLHVEKDSGQADALNRGFARVSGTILGFLNSDDTLFPGTLHRVAREIDPARGRWIVMGRCLFIGENSPYVGVEHPAEYVSRFEHLAIWKRGFNTIPQPSVFWHRDVWTKCGGFDVNEHHALDYDLFCRMSRHYFFHRVDELFSHYRMHDASKSAQRSEAEVLELTVRVSRKHWGSWLRPLRWRCEISCWLHDRDRHERARHHARRAEEAFGARHLGTAFVEFLRTLFASPVMARDRLVLAWLRQAGLGFLVRRLVRPEEFSGVYGDGWIGPRFEQVVAAPAAGGEIRAELWFHPQPGYPAAKVQLRLDGRQADARRVESVETFALSARVAPGAARPVRVEVLTDAYFVPKIALGGEDGRRLSLKLVSLRVPGDSGGKHPAT